MCKKMDPEQRKAVAKRATDRAILYREEGLKGCDRNDHSLKGLYREDCKQLKHVYSLFRQGKYSLARNLAQSLDTAVRDAVDSVVWEEIHGKEIS